MQINFFRENDIFDPENSHVISGIINKIYIANKEKLLFVALCGIGKPIREFLFTNDMVKNCIKDMSLLKNKINRHKRPQQFQTNEDTDTGKGISIKELSSIIALTVGFKDKIIFDDNYPDGHPKKVDDISIQTKLGIKIKFDLKR